MKVRTRHPMFTVLAVLAMLAGLLNASAPPALAASSTDIVSTVAGNGTWGTPSEGAGTASPLAYLGDVAIAPEGTPLGGSTFLIVNSEVWRLTPAGEFSRFAGGGDGFTEGEPAREAQLGGSPIAIDVAPDGQVYFGTSAGVMYRVDSQGSIHQQPADALAQTFISYARGMDVDSQGRAYLAVEANTYYVVERLEKDGSVTNIAGIRGNSLGCGPVYDKPVGEPDRQVINMKLTGPRDVVLSADERTVYVADSLTHVILSVPIGNPGGYSTTQGSCFDNTSSAWQVSSLALHDGTLYWTSRHRIFSDAGLLGGSTTGGYSGDGGPASAALFNLPSSIDVGDDGALVATDSWNYRVRQITPAPADTDGDGIYDDNDNCSAAANADQSDSDEDGIGDACDDTEDPAPPLVDDVSNGRILYDNGDTQLWTANPDGSDARPAGNAGIPNSSFDARWSPDGRLIAAATAYFGVNVIDPEAGTTTLLDDGWAHGELDWSPDGRWIAADKSVNGTQSLWLYSVDGAERIDVLGGQEGGLESVDWSRDGRLLFDFYPKDAPATGGAFIYDMQSDTMTPVGVQGGHMRWSPDGKRIVMERGSDDCAFSTECSVIGTSDLDGSGWRRLTAPDGNEHEPFWSPAGDRIAYFTWKGPDQFGGLDAAFSTVARNGVDAVVQDHKWYDVHDWQPVLAPMDDADGDGTLNHDDACPTLDDDGTDTDGDGFGDGCDPDEDNDGYGALADNCPDVANPTQKDADEDGFGDDCERVLTVAHGGAAWGTITGDGINCGDEDPRKDDCSESYPEGTTVTLTATPAGGSQFGGWDGCNAIDEAGRCEVTMTSAREVVATFVPTPKHALTVTRAGDGVGVVTGPGIDCRPGAKSVCTHSYEPGTQVNLVATPEGGSRFGSWTGCLSVDGATCTVTMDAAKHVTATFEEIPEHELTVALAGDGSGNVLGPGINCGSDCDSTYPEGTPLTLVATPDATSTFEGWTGCDDVQEGDCLVTMDAVRTVTATFEPTVAETRSVTVERSGKGTGTVVATNINCGEECVGSYPTGTVVRLMAYPAEGSTFKGWANCDYTAGTECVVTASTDRIVGAKFAPATAKVKTEITSSTIKSKKRKATFEFTGSSTLGTVSFECRIDDKKFKSCSSPRTYRRLKPGSHTFMVRAVDSTGATDPTPAEEKFVIRR